VTELNALPDGRLAFSFSECELELRALWGVSARFLDVSAEAVLERFRDRLRVLRATPTGAFYRWEIKREESLLTIPSEGRFERGHRGGRTIQASIDGIWEIEPLGASNRASVPNRMFALGRKASARVVIFDPATGEELGMWRIESGDPASPGTFFHIQVLGQEVAPPFPESVSIPRFPGSWVLLPGAVEFVIAELFQDEWEEASMRDSPGMKAWRPIQLKRLERQLDWQRGVLASRTGSPWSSLKRELPPPMLFAR
jgi:hypothetical protein